jgi:hypothetical protein
MLLLVGCGDGTSTSGNAPDPRASTEGVRLSYPTPVTEPPVPSSTDVSGRYKLQAPVVATPNNGIPPENFVSGPASGRREPG